MIKRIRHFYKISGMSQTRVPPEKENRKYRHLRLQTLIAAIIGYSLYYICRISLSVVKQPLIDSGTLTAAQLGGIGAALLFTYAVGKFVNGFMADYCNIKRFMATGLVVSAFINLVMGLTGLWESAAGISNIALFLFFAIIWGMNGWAQSMGSAPAVITLSRWFPLNKRGTYYGFICATPSLGEFLSFLYIGALVTAFGWQWGFIGAAAAGIAGAVIIAVFMHDNPESKGLPPVEVINKEKFDPLRRKSIKQSQKQVLLTSGIWIIAISSAFLYICRYAINGWGVLFLQKVKEYPLETATQLIAVYSLLGVVGTVFSGWISDTLFRGKRMVPAILFGILGTGGLLLFLYGDNTMFTNITALVACGLSIGILMSLIGGIMAIDIVPRRGTGAALGIVGIANYISAGIQDISTGLLIDANITEVTTAAGEIVKEYDFSQVSVFWIAASALSFLIPVIFWKKLKAKGDEDLS
ncbi:MAG: MFS transporter [Muribaculum sp.]|uniref:MFS transporter n=1 Tax=Candidatus Merdivivens faecigallinarum TaxID=2840871 RepID=A0A9D9NQD6_9BACT|nr:MFS transporter [Candidatus Merdivivens faecigallinarum]